MISKIKTILQNNDTKNDYNPDLIINTIYLKNKKLYLVQEGKLLFGTKQRASYLILEKLKTPKTKAVLYVGGYNGFGPAALAYGAWKHGLKAIICIAYKTTEKLDIFMKSKQRASLIALNASIILFKTFVEAREYADKIYKKNKEKYIYPAMGMNSSTLINILSEQIKKASAKTDIFIPDTTIFLVSGSGGVAMSLFKAFPNLNFGIFTTGGERYISVVKKWAQGKNNVVVIPDIIDKIGTIVPYPTVADYDDYIYPYIERYGNDGDIIWNIASDEII